MFKRMLITGALALVVAVSATGVAAGHSPKSSEAAGFSTLCRFCGTPPPVVNFTVSNETIDRFGYATSWDCYPRLTWNVSGSTAVQLEIYSNNNGNSITIPEPANGSTMRSTWFDMFMTQSSPAVITYSIHADGRSFFGTTVYVDDLCGAPH